jgi:hypothetical protein
LGIALFVSHGGLNSGIIKIDKNHFKTVKSTTEPLMTIRFPHIIFLALFLLQGVAVLASIPEKEVLKSIKNGEITLLNQFLEEGANVDAFYDNEKTTLLNFAIRQGNENAVRLLISYGANPNIASKGNTPLINAVIKKELMTLHLLINQGARLDTAVKNGNTALIYAAKSGRMNCVRMLVENGANAEIKNDNGLTALDFANMANYPEVAEYLVRIIEMRNYYKGLPNYTDGPHIEWIDDNTTRMFYMIYDTAVNYPVKREKFIAALSDTTLVSGFAGDSLDYTLIKNVKSPPDDFQNVGKILAIGDMHGHYCALVEYLKSNGVIDNDLNWIWGDGHIVFLGDVFDRGNEVTESLWFIHELDLKARLHGGYVHMLLGNHEVMVMGNDTRYINRKYELFSNYFTRDYADFFNTNSILGQWLRTRNAVIRINNCLFSHAGISPAVLNRKLTLEKINSVLRGYLAVKPDTPMADADIAMLILNEDGPLWYRGFLMDRFGKKKITQKEVRSVLKFYDVEKMIIAHTEVKELTSLFDGKVIAIDVPIRTESAIQEALLIENGKFYRLTDENLQLPCLFGKDRENP